MLCTAIRTQHTGQSPHLSRTITTHLLGRLTRLPRRDQMTASSHLFRPSRIFSGSQIVRPVLRVSDNDLHP